MARRNVKLIIQYDGTDFHGWQRQPDTRTVQGELEQAIRHVLRVPVLTEGASRTDAGVHALGQVANFQTEVEENLLTPDRLAAAVNSRLPEDAAVVSAADVPEEFSSRSARGKIYHYLILNTPRASPLLRRRALHVREELDLDAMSAAAAAIVGKRDYAAFGAKTGREEAERNTVCDVEKVGVDTVLWPVLAGGPERLIRIEVKGDRFLYKMVRTIAGTLLEVGKGKLLPGEISDIIKSRDRRRAGPTLKPHGLYLVKVFF